MELYSHNELSYTKVKDVLSRSTNVLIVQATGTGKSFITMKLLQDDFVDLKILYIVPSMTIRDNLRLYNDWVEDNITFMTYHKLSKQDINYIINSYDVFVIDEVHHAGSRVWSKPVKSLLESSKICIGLTATPIRSTDKIDISDLLFKDCTVYGPDIKQAIEKSIWSSFDYIATVNSIEEELVEAQKKLDNLPDSRDIYDLKVKSLGFNLSDLGAYEIGVIVQKYIKRNYNKWLIFCSNNYQLSSIDEDILTWFGNPAILKVNSSMSKKKVTDAISKFNYWSEDRPVILASINVLNEGVHISGVDGVIMLRHTESYGLYLQQLGRGLTTNKDKHPVFIDTADNIFNLRSNIGAMRSLGASVISPKSIDKEADLLHSNEVFVEDTILLSALEFIDKVNNIKEDEIWTDKEIWTLRTYYPEVYDRINKSKASIKKKAIELGLKKVNKFEPWEDAIILCDYPKYGSSIFESLNNKTKDMVRRRAKKLEVNYKGRWSWEEDEELLRTGKASSRTEQECKERLTILRRKL